MSAHVAFQHHERYDGSGYPRGLTDRQTLDIAKVTAVADSYNAMTSDRPYRRGLMPHQALPILAREAGKSYNPDVVRAFIKIVAAYPLGTVVRLSDGSVATVVGVTREICDVQIVSGPREGNHVSIHHESDIHIIERVD
jgi:HD-GYP domain-containing protein (c-di-GMP phosphodiesterase class II)